MPTGRPLGTAERKEGMSITLMPPVRYRMQWNGERIVPMRRSGSQPQQGVDRAISLSPGCRTWISVA